MATVFSVYNTKDAKTADEYEKYLKQKKVTFIRSQPWAKSYEIYRIDGVLGSPPRKPPYQFVAKMEVSSLGEFAQWLQTPESQAFLKEYDAYLEPSGGLRGFTVGHKVEPRT